MTDILMATYNGEKYIRQQIESILCQSCKDWKLYISDDCSTDNTVDIIGEYCKKYPDKVFLSVRDKNSGCPAVNFLDMISKSNADYIMTADQDDIWDRDKVRVTVDALNRGQKNVPLLVHTDLCVVDEDMHRITESMISMQHIPVNKTSINSLVVQNVVTGCTMGINRALADILKKPRDIPVHDWWIACTASIFGSIVFVDKSTILYRQHGSNTCGAKNMESVKYLMQRLKGSGRSKYMMRLGYVMARELLDKYDIDGRTKKILSEYASLEKSGKLKKLFVVCRYNFWKSGFLRKVGQLWFM